jgi:hypothetical protein
MKIMAVAPYAVDLVPMESSIEAIAKHRESPAALVCALLDLFYRDFITCIE